MSRVEVEIMVGQQQSENKHHHLPHHIFHMPQQHSMLNMATLFQKMTVKASWVFV